MRLDQFLSTQCAISRKQARQQIRMGAATVDGSLVDKPDMQLNPQKQQVTLHGKPVVYRPFEYLILNKPKQVVCATEDKQHQTVLELVPKELFRRGLFPAGRLDGDTTGLVLLTDDGAFAHRLLSPRRHVDKTYRVCLSSSISPDDIQTLEAGAVLSDGSTCKPAELSMVRAGDRPELLVILQEGKYHQIKRMFASVGNRVTELERIAIGALTLDPALQRGACRRLSDEERARLTLPSPYRRSNK